MYAKVIGEMAPLEDPLARAGRQSALSKQADFSLEAYRYWSSASRVIAHDAAFFRGSA
jgi:hypothetical protein